MGQEVVPVLRAGYLPPIAAGFNEFLKADRIANESQQVVEAAESNGQTDLFDTHPSLSDRLAALAVGQEVTGSAETSEPAYSLIAGIEAQARALSEFTFGADSIRKLKPIDWPSVGEAVYAEGWRSLMKSQTQWLSRFTADGLPVGKHAFIRLGSELVHRGEQSVNSDARIARAVYVLAAGIGVLLLDDGWHARTTPGKAVLLVRGSEMFEPIGAVSQLAAVVIADTTADAWKARCRELGVLGRPLASSKPVAQVVRTAATGPIPLLVPQPAAVEEVRCWSCKHPLITGDDKNRGTKVRCPQCGTKQQLPR